MKRPTAYNITPAKGQSLLSFQGRRMPDKVTLFETLPVEEVRQPQKQERLKTDRQKDINPDLRNLLIHGDCLSACAYLKSQDIKIDLVYIDPPFASGANYAKNIYLRNGGRSEIANEDTNIGEEVMYGDIWQKEDYLNWLYERLLAIRDVMSETASIYVHLDWHIGHYVKILMDEVFGEENFRNEIVWYYPDNFQGNVKGFATNHNTVFWYSKTDEYTANKVYIELENKVKRDRRIWSKEEHRITAARDENGKIIYDDFTHKKLDDVWSIGQSSVTKEKSREYQDYATQKPEELLKRVITASSEKGFIVADFFVGSGTTAKVAHDLGRKFIACDIGINAVQTTRDRLVQAGAEFDVLKINDGVRLFRNPAQTTAKIFSLIDGFKSRTELDLGEFWEGAIAGRKGAYVPVKFIGIDKVLTKELIDVILEEIYQLEDATDETEAVKIIYAHKDMDIDRHYVNKEIGKTGKTTIKAELIHLDELLGQKAHMLFLPDNADIAIKRDGERYKVEIKRYFSSYLKNKIDDFNAKKVKKKGAQAAMESEEETGSEKQPSRAVSEPLHISETGLEFIESVQFDTTLKKGEQERDIWTSNPALEDKAGVRDKIKGVYYLLTDKFRIKIRNIAGDEIMIDGKDVRGR